MAQDPDEQGAEQHSQPGEQGSEQAPEFGLVKTADGPEGERFWIVRLHVRRGTLERTVRSLDEQTARDQLVELGCPAEEVDDLFQKARQEFGK
jgi:hypothetical protein